MVVWLATTSLSGTASAAECRRSARSSINAEALVHGCAGGLLHALQYALSKRRVAHLTVEL